METLLLSGLFVATECSIFFGEKFKVSKNLVYSYVKVVINTESHTLQMYMADEFVESFNYQLPMST